MQRKNVKLLMPTNNVSHTGKVIKTEGDLVTVHFIQNSACSGCHARALCSGGSSESADRTVVARAYGQKYNVGEEVKVLVSQGLAWSAVKWAFMVPLVLALVALFALVPLVGEVIACLGTLGALAVYYGIFYMLRHKLERKVEFTLSRS